MHGAMGGTSIVAATIILLLIFLPIVRTLMTGYLVVALLVAVEMGLFASSIFLSQVPETVITGWGLISVVVSIAVVGASIRDAIRDAASRLSALQAPTQASTAAPVENLVARPSDAK